MASLKKIKKKSGTAFYYSLVRCVKWAKARHISLDTSSKQTANVRHSEVNRFELSFLTKSKLSLGGECI